MTIYGPKYVMDMPILIAFICMGKSIRMRWVKQVLADIPFSLMQQSYYQPFFLSLQKFPLPSVSVLAF